MSLEKKRALDSATLSNDLSSSGNESIHVSIKSLIENGGNGKDGPSQDGLSRVCKAGLSDPDVEIDEFGFLNLTEEKVWKYYKNYHDRIDKLHPFLGPWLDLDIQIREFISRYCPQEQPPATVLQKSPATLSDKPRNYNEEATGLGGSCCGSPLARRQYVEPSYKNIIFLLIFALGAICEGKIPFAGSKIEGFSRVPGTESSTQNPENLHSINNHSSPDLLSFERQGQPNISRSNMPAPYPSYSSRHISGCDEDPETQISPSGWTRAIIQDKDEPLRSQPLSLVPGLAMYRYATSLLDLIENFRRLEYTQACLLAGLYADQLKHPFKSHEWISQAAQSCQLHCEKFEDYTEEPYKAAYWSCLQLEVDLSGELGIPVSELSRHESLVPFQKRTSTSTVLESDARTRTRMLLLYSARAYLHKTLGRLYTSLSKLEGKKERGWSSSVQEVESMNLDLWRFSLPDEMIWNDEGNPAKEISTAFMRASYYRARYIIHRPLLYHALRYAPLRVSARDDTGSTFDSQRESFYDGIEHFDVELAHKNIRIGDWKLHNILLRDLPGKLRRACKICVDSAILHTTAFDSIENGFVMTNIFGIAHA